MLASSSWKPLPRREAFTGLHKVQADVPGPSLNDLAPCLLHIVKPW